MLAHAGGGSGGGGGAGILHIYLCKENYLLHRSCLVIAGNIKCRKRRIDRIKLVPLSAVVQRARVRDQNIRAKVCSKTDRSRQVPTMVLCLRKVVFWMVVTNKKVVAFKKSLHMEVHERVSF